MLVAVLFSSSAFAEEAVEKLTTATDLGLGDKEALLNSPISDDGGAFPVNFLWTIVAGILVFWMQAGFSLVEAGFTRAKNAVNIFMKNIMDFSIGSLIFWFVGFGFMFGSSSGFIGTDHFFGDGVETMWDYAFLFFQTVFAATAATIVSGAMAERTKFTGYLAYSIGVTAFIYPIFGSWAWNGLAADGGWLEGAGGVLASLGGGEATFIDFAGSTVVHSVGGWAALAGAIVLGPRLGKFAKDGTPRPIRGHSMSLAALGCFILWMGWFGFNAGSTTSVTGDGGKMFALIAVNTNLAACAGAVLAMLVSWKTAGKPDIGMTINGSLAGLVGITAPCA
jgi:Amt family ammonium transporter